MSAYTPPRGTATPGIIFRFHPAGRVTAGLLGNFETEEVLVELAAGILPTAEAVWDSLRAKAEAQAEALGALAGEVRPEQRSWSRAIDAIEAQREGAA
jgi:hypothetical protein